MYPNLKIAMWKAGVRQRVLAQQLNLNETVVSKVMNGTRKPSPRMRATIAEFFQVDPEWLFEQATIGVLPAPKGNGKNGGEEKAR